MDHSGLQPIVSLRVINAGQSGSAAADQWWSGVLGGLFERANQSPPFNWSAAAHQLWAECASASPSARKHAKRHQTWPVTAATTPTRPGQRENTGGSKPAPNNPEKYRKRKRNYFLACSPLLLLRSDVITLSKYSTLSLRGRCEREVENTERG